MNDPPLTPWVAVEQGGQILCAHCTCMAGYIISFETLFLINVYCVLNSLGEACMFSHSSSNNVLGKGSRTVAKNWSGFMYFSEVLMVTKHKRGN